MANFESKRQPILILKNALLNDVVQQSIATIYKRRFSLSRVFQKCWWLMSIHKSPRTKYILLQYFNTSSLKPPGVQNVFLGLSNSYYALMIWYFRNQFIHACSISVWLGSPQYSLFNNEVEQIYYPFYRSVNWIRLYKWLHLHFLVVFF